MTSSIDASVAQLQQSAKNIKDIEDWLIDNPYIILGDITYPSNTWVDVKLTLNWSEFLHSVVASEAVKVMYNVGLAYENIVTSDKKLFLNFKHDSRPRTVLAHTGEMAYRLSDWPFATAMTAARYFNTRTFEDERNWARKLEEILEGNLQKHFPKFSLSTLRDIVESDLLSKQKGGAVDMDAVMDVLFASVAPTIQADILSLDGF